MNRSYLLAIGAATLLLINVTASPISAASLASRASAGHKPTPVPRTSGGDIPDTATYLRFHTRAYSVEYVEGWVRRSLSSGGLRVSDIDSYEMVTMQARPSQPLVKYVRGPGTLRSSKEYRHFVKKAVTPISLPAGASMRLSFRALSQPDPVTGKQVTLAIDRYYISGKHHLAVVTLATPVGVDNVDAFRRIARSFTWIKG